MSRLFLLGVLCLIVFVLSACGGAAPAPAAPTAAPAAPKAEAPKAEAPKAAAPAGKAASQPAQPTLPPIPTKAAAPFVTTTAQPRVLVEPTAAAKATSPAPAAKATGAPAAGGAAAGGPTAPGVATGRRSEVKFDFIKQLSTAEEVDDIRLTLTRVPGILDLAGNETAITVGYDAGLILPNQIARRLAEMGHEVKPPA